MSERLQAKRANQAEWSWNRAMNGGTERLYLDHNASAPLRPQALARMVEVLGVTGNPSSVHGEGRKLRGVVEDAREALAAMCGVKARSVIFTSGATEANVLALSPRWQGNDGPVYLDRLLMSAVEHPSVRAGGRFAAREISYIATGENGVLRLDHLDELLAAGGPALVSVMAANNETGVIQPLAEIGAKVKAAGGLFHVDGVQFGGRLPVDIAGWQADAVSLSAHKMGGPQGIGALVLRTSALAPGPLLIGGGQEQHRRAGTENAAAIAAFGAIARDGSTMLEEFASLARLQGLLEDGLRLRSGSTVVFGADAPRLANTTCFAVPGVPSEMALMALDLNGIALSSGSACSSGKVGASHVLTAMGIAEDLGRCALRVSLGWTTQEADIARFLKVWARVAATLNPSATGKAA